MVDVIELKPQPHVTGPAKCLVCDHEWVSVVPAGVRFFDYPECACSMGVRMGEVHGERAQHIWSCNCGNSVFSVELLDDCPYLLCVCCGVTTPIVIGGDE